MANRTVSVQLKAEIADFMGKMGAAGRGAKQFGDELNTLGKNSPDKLNDVAMAAGGAGVALLGMAGYAANAAMKFDKQMSEVASVSNATGKELEQLRAAALQAGKDTSFSATEAAQAEAELAKAGLSTSEIMGGALKGSLSLAAAGQMNLADAAKISAQAMNMFELKGGDVSHIADVLASAANTSAADMHGLGMGLQQVGLVAHQAGFSLEETTGLLAAFADRGLDGSDGATSLKTAIQRLVSPTKEASTQMSELGLEVYDANGHVKSASEIAGALQESLSGLGEAERNAAMNTIFGSDAIRAANVMYGLGADGVNKYTDNVNKQGAAAETAAEKMDNLAGDLEKLKGSIETLAIEGGSGASGGLRVLTQTADNLVGSFLNMPSAVSGTATVLAGLGGSALLAFAGFTKVRSSARDALDAISEMGPRGEKTAGKLETVGKYAGRAALAFGAVQVAGALLSTAFASGAVNVDLMTASLEKFAKTGEKSGELKRVFGGNLKDFGIDVATIADKGGMNSNEMKFGESLMSFAGLSGMDWSVNSTKQRVLDLDKALAGMVQSGHASEAATAVGKLAHEAEKNGVSTKKFMDMLPGYNGAVEQMSSVTNNAASAASKAGAAAVTMATGLEAAIQSAGGLKQAFDNLNGTEINLTQAQINVEASVRAFDAALKESHGSLDVSTEKGGAAMQAALALASAGAEVADKTFKASGSAEEAGAVFNQYRGRLIDAAVAADMSRDEAEKLANRIMSMPEFRPMKVHVDGLIDAIRNGEGLASILNRLDGKVSRSSVITTYQTIRQEVLYPAIGRGEGQGQSRTRIPQRWGGVTEYAAAGLLRDPNIYTPNGPARYGFAEPATQGEAFIPRNGDRLRSLGILTKAAGWYGANISTGGIPAGGVRASTQTTRIIIDGTGVLEGLRREVYVRGGNVQQVVGRTGR